MTVKSGVKEEGFFLCLFSESKKSVPLCAQLHHISVLALYHRIIYFIFPSWSVPLLI